ncbi:FAST kinase domain-containing protein 3, mitochondrial-like [Palaemon carinicauda]|uniref:FAST kinase domain-containing protein 3, mitochondrial-like n=1 Tax=Palaemon carinicauda TaxID=392227 RepID=UPI0035B62367
MASFHNIRSFLPLSSRYGHQLRRRTLSLPTLGHARGITKSTKHFTDDEKTISNTTIIMQDGINIEELPSIVQIIHGEFIIFSNGKSQAGKRFEGLGMEIPQVSKKLFSNINFEEEQEIILGFMRCRRVTDIFNLLEVCPEEEVTPKVALAIIKQMFELENNVEFRNRGLNQYPEEASFTFTRGAVMKRLIEIICCASEPKYIVNALQVMGRDTFQGDKLKYLEFLCTHCIVLITEGKLAITQVCDAAKAFYNLGPIGSRYVEQVWVGITDKTNCIHEKEIYEVMSILPLVKQSRKHLYNAVEKSMINCWFKFKCEDIIKILHILVQLRMTNSRMLPMISKWTDLNIHALTDGNLRWIVYSIMSLGYTDNSAQKALARFMKARKGKDMSPDLVSVIMDYCAKMRIRSPEILDSAGDFFIRKASILTVPHINSICRAYGLLNYEPPNASAFFLTFESYVDEKFVQFPPNVMVDLLLSCVYLKRYPLNFVKKVFNPYFFDRIHTLEASDLRLTRTKLKVLDQALTLEAPNYSGPMLPKDPSAKSYWRDARVMRCVNMIQPALIEIVGSEERIVPSALLPNFPGTELYIIDCVIDMEGKLNFRSFKWSKNKYALIVNLPDHYVVNEDILVGPQAMRCRHLALAGFKVVNINFEKVCQYRMYPDSLKSYLEKAMKKATIL